MTYTLTLCIGLFLGLCGQTREVDFPSYEACDRERQQQLPRVGKGYAICAPKGAVRRQVQT